MTLVSLPLNIIIEREIGTPVHGKYVVDCLNAINKKLLRENMNRLSIILPQLFKALVCFIMPPVGQILVFRINARIF